MLVHTNRIFFALLCLSALLLAVCLPAGAVNGTISIAYRGSGGSYIGDTVVFDGYNTFGNTTLLRLTGPTLPEEGVPLLQADGVPGTSTSVEVDNKGFWKYVWYTGNIRGIGAIGTARYTITASDPGYPEETASTSIYLKRPEFSFVITPSTARSGEYIQLTGTSEKDSPSVHFEVADSSGKVVHTYDTSVSSSGYFNKGFHVDMAPGVYTITMSSPTVTTTTRGYLTVNGSAESVAATGTVAAPATASPATATGTSGPGSLTVSSIPSGATVFLNSAMVGTTPYSVDEIASGNYVLEVKAPGYTTFTETITIRKGETTSVSPALARGAASPLSLPVVLAGLLVAACIILASRNRKE